MAQAEQRRDRLRDFRRSALEGRQDIRDALSAQAPLDHAIEEKSSDQGGDFEQGGRILRLPEENQGDGESVGESQDRLPSAKSGEKAPIQSEGSLARLSLLGSLESLPNRMDAPGRAQQALDAHAGGGGGDERGAGGFWHR